MVYFGTMQQIYYIAYSLNCALFVSGVDYILINYGRYDTFPFLQMTLALCPALGHDIIHSINVTMIIASYD